MVGSVITSPSVTTAAPAEVTTAPADVTTSASTLTDRILTGVRDVTIALVAAAVAANTNLPFFGSGKRPLPDATVCILKSYLIRPVRGHP